MMKLTLIRTDNDNRQHLSTKTLEQFAERVKTETKERLVSELRQEIPCMGGFDVKFPKMNLLPRVYPTAEWRRDERGDLSMAAFNGVVLLSIGPFRDACQIEAAKQAVAGLPSTVMAVMGASGRTLKVLVAVASADGQQPAGEDEADSFYQAAHAYAARIYEGATGQMVAGGQPSVRDSFRMTVDPVPYLNVQSQALTVPLQTPSTHRQPTTAERQSQPADPDHTMYDEVEYLYRRVVASVYEELDTEEWRQSPYRDEAATAEIARRMCQLGIDEEETVAHLYHHLWSRQQEQHIRGVVASAYEAARVRKQKADPIVGEILASARIRRDTLALIDFLGSRYQLRYNVALVHLPTTSTFSSMRWQVHRNCCTTSLM